MAKTKAIAMPDGRFYFDCDSCTWQSIPVPETYLMADHVEHPAIEHEKACLGSR